MVELALRKRVERLLEGERRVHDLVELFLFARERCDGRESIQEVGDFQAHRTERVKGPLTRSARDTFAILQFQAQALAEIPMRAEALDPDFPTFLKATAGRLSGADLKRVGLSKREVTNAVERATSSMRLNSDGTFNLMRSDNSGLSITPDDTKVIEYLMHVLVIKPAFDGERLVSDFIATLRSLSLLQKEEVRKANSLAPFIQLYACSVMHNCTIVMGNDNTSLLKLRLGEPRGDTVRFGGQTSLQGIEINAVMTLTKGRPGLKCAMATFTTKLIARDHCTDRLLTDNASDGALIDLTPSGQLDLM